MCPAETSPHIRKPACFPSVIVRSSPQLAERLCCDQSTRRLARHAGPTPFGVNPTGIEPGAWSSHRHGGLRHLCKQSLP